MRRGRLATLAILDEAVERVFRELPGWAGLAGLATLPLRFLEVHFLNRALELGSHAGEHGRYLTSLSWLITLALPLAFWGRAVLAHAVTLTLSGERRLGRRPFQLRPAALAAGFYAYLAAQVLVLAFSFTVAGSALALILAGLAVATVPLQERVGPWAPLGTAFGNVRPLRVHVGLFLLAAVAFGVAFVNLAALFDVGLWAAQALPGLDLTRWEALLSLHNRHFRLLLAAGAALAVEPFWIAALAVTVHRKRAQQSGEDLRAWFEELVAERAA
ncbi:MAG TPA: hypothetical protein VFE33_20305 [Thermoanaerobaculia bacterium]|nr:hypothetical protein [Thermoanaerobaculia bacterium]